MERAHRRLVGQPESQGLLTARVPAARMWQKKKSATIEDLRFGRYDVLHIVAMLEDIDTTTRTEAWTYSMHAMR